MLLVFRPVFLEQQAHVLSGCLLYIGTSTANPKREPDSGPSHEGGGSIESDNDARNGHEAVIRSMNQSFAMERAGRASVELKVNCVVIRGIDDREILDLTELEREDDIKNPFQ